MVDSILRTWADWEDLMEGSFTTFGDGNWAYCAFRNLKRVHISKALNERSEYDHEWSRFSPLRFDFVLKHRRYFRRLTKVLFAPKKRCQIRGKRDEARLMVCSGCEQMWYCRRKHQREDWK